MNQIVKTSLFGLVILALTTGCGHKRQAIRSLASDNADLALRLKNEEMITHDLRAEVEKQREALVLSAENLSDLAEELKSAKLEAEAQKQSFELSADQTRSVIACGDWSKLAKRALPISASIRDGKVTCNLPPGP
ncbi:hypothetical protein CO173_03990 [Candidatus Uhrbacteria bacterium CG_4_9_14_3_um_filter_41_35]|uniref:Uncharacterized protein n=1 Tax=Candidatus Uhrbacteria bacterium CG_4_9_14_3_um_filter_41_35 TaxID=1975034 RepID=A0A2M7XDN8_9BACT|nr:MAG: hypothetical protein COV92_01305 [Candidatus Uhrbacteria bacterium CG11_big_fil_rev_8_21_14_0_20_41_9]PJA46008.1 MAG: hypothetical protein CO173_03990 [Candidatus Uhrbacteria bacterium CG_4_9_14_3_um_filter_41_35]